MEVGLKERFKNTFVWIRLKRYSHVKRMRDYKKLMKRSDVQKEEGKGGEEDHEWVKRDLEREGGEWRTTTNDRKRWRLVIEDIILGK